MYLNQISYLVYFKKRKIIIKSSKYLNTDYAFVRDIPSRYTFNRIRHKEHV
jgi:hypothetical protein